MPTTYIPDSYNQKKKLTKEDIVEIKSLYKKWVLPSELSIKYHVSYHCIRYALWLRKKQNQVRVQTYEEKKKHNERKKELLKQKIIKRINPKIRSWYSVRVYRGNELLLQADKIKDIAKYMHVSYSTVNQCIRKNKQDKHGNRYVWLYY